MQEQGEIHDAILDRLNRRLRTLSQCTSTFLQAAGEQELLQSLCEILVAGGDCRLAWIGYCEDDADQTIRPVAQAGSGLEYVERVKTSWRELEAGQGQRVWPLGPAKCVASMISGRIRGFLRGGPLPSPAAMLRALPFR